MIWISKKYKKEEWTLGIYLPVHFVVFLFYFPPH